MQRIIQDVANVMMVRTMMTTMVKMMMKMMKMMIENSGAVQKLKWVCVGGTGGAATLMH